MRSFLICCLLAFQLGGMCQIPPGYYHAAQGLHGDTLKQVLHQIIKNHTIISYSAVWTAMKKTDKKPNGKVWDIYSDVPGGVPPYEYNFITDQCGSYAVEGDCYNREHSWPQSWFNSVPGPSSDLFHLYPTDGKVNGIRSNYPYGRVGIASITTLNGSKLGPCIDSGYTNIVFEPLDEYKGDLARSYFYMTTRYLNEDATWSSSDATQGANILPWQMNILLEWNRMDTVSAKEIARNDSIYYHIQHNRNPFIDHWQWADSIWHHTLMDTATHDTTVIIGVQKITEPADASFQVYPNPVTNAVTIVRKNGSKQDIGNPIQKILISDVFGREYKIPPTLPAGHTINSSLIFNVSNLSSGLYFIRIIESNGKMAELKFIKE